MGDGGVACMPLQHIMERFPIPDKLCGGNNGSIKFSNKKMKLNKEEAATEKQKVEVGEVEGNTGNCELDNGKVCPEKGQKEEVEEGELGTLKWPKSEVETGEIVTERPRRSENENGEFLPGKWKKGKVERGEIVSAKWRKWEVEKGEIVLERTRKGESEKLDSWRGSSREVEKGEFIPDRWQKKEVGKDQFGYRNSRRYDVGNREKKSWKYEAERIPPCRRYPLDEKDFSRSGSLHGKSSLSRLDTGPEKNQRLSSKIVSEVSYKIEESNGKNHDRESNRLKRHVTDFVGGDGRHHSESGDHKGSKSRRISDDNVHTVQSEHQPRRSAEKPYRNTSSARISSSDRYSSRYQDSLSSKVVYDRHGRSPGHSERSPRDRARYHDHKDRTPPHRDRSPHDRSRQSDHRNRTTPAYLERSPQNRARQHDHKDHTSNCLERSPHDRNRPNNVRESSRKNVAGDQRHSHEIKNQEDKVIEREYRKDSLASEKESGGKNRVQDANGSIDEVANSESCKNDQLQSPTADFEEPLRVGVIPEEPCSMEEDMDICNTPPHTTVVDDSNAGKWFFLDHHGVEQGPSKLCDVKRLVEEGILVSDHMIKHVDGDRWVTVENATSPLVTANFTTVAPDSISQLVNPPEASGNLLVDTGELGQSINQLHEKGPLSLPQPLFIADAISAGLNSLGDLYIDERVKALLEGFPVFPGKELEAVGDALHMRFEHVFGGLANFEALTLHLCDADGHLDEKTNVLFRDSDSTSKEIDESRTTAYAGYFSGDHTDWFSSLWSCKGGDWKRNDEAVQDRPFRKKLVLNDGYSLCQMPKSGYEDPRLHRKDELYYPSLSRRLDLPPWAFTLPDESNEANGISRSSQVKPFPVRGGVKGTAQTVVRINACVVKDRGSFVIEPLSKVRAKERSSSRSSRSYSATGDARRLSVEGASSSISKRQEGSRDSLESLPSINTPKDHVCRVDELQLQLGDWYYLDGAGRERGPSSFSDLQVLVDHGRIQKCSSVFRKNDKVWVPINSSAEVSALPREIGQKSILATGESSGPSPQLRTDSGRNDMDSSLFHSMHPQFIGYTRGKLHELVMKSYKSREFAAAINEVLDPWINAKQPKKEVDVYLSNSTTNKRSDGGFLSAKRSRMMVDGSEDDYEMTDVSAGLESSFTFDDLCGDATFHKENGECSEADTGTWGFLHGHMLARVFHFLRADTKSLILASLTCKQWRAAAKFYKDISRHVDLSTIGPNCTDSIVRNVMNDYNKENITSMALIGCKNVTSSTVEEILGLFPYLTSMDIRGCFQFEELATKFPNVSWVMNSGPSGNFGDSHPRIRSNKQITEKNLLGSKTLKVTDSQGDDFSELKEYFDSVDKRDAANQSFRRSLYKRSKLFDARKSSSILSRDARIRRWAMKKSDNWYRRIEEFLALGLKNIMKENTFDFFVPKVAEIEGRMKSGYYINRGLRSVKEDISRMCRDAIKAKNRGDVGNINHVITSFIQLATNLEENSKSSNERDEIMKIWKNGSSTSLSSAPSKYKKKLQKLTSERKYISKGLAFGASENGEFVSDKEIRRRLSKLNRKSMDSGSETSDDLNESSEDSESDSERTASETESDLNFRSESGSCDSKRDGSFMADKDLDSFADDREWGARMTKASLVPPVTRKYEVIEQYVIVADEEGVKRKMQVSLPEDYAEKLRAQKNGTEESDMEIPEVKDFKPRKTLGNEVIEQEVYGIDPYTHNLLLDSMPEDWPLLEKHLFIEDVLLRGLNKQVRHFTGTGNTPMKYHLRPIVEEIRKLAEEDRDMRIFRICQSMLKAMDSRPDDNYVAYRKGLGVVCNKDGGFSEDDFVVEFLGEVYPAWKWYEKQDGIRSLQKDSGDPAPEFYNIFLERPKGDADGYDLVVVDAMHKANYASRICHSCRPNCEAKVTAVDGHYQIGIYSVRPIQYGEEITFDYNSVTESKEEYEASVCLCGSQVCRGSYLNLTGEGAFLKVLKQWHGMLDRHQLMLEACELNRVSEEDYIDLGRAGLGSCLLGGLPEWLVAYSARLVRYINFERTKLPEEILRHNLEEKRKYFAEICLDVEKSDAEVQAEGVYNQRLQNLALTLDKVRYVMRCIFGDPKKAPPPLERLSPEATVSLLWKGEGSLVEELLQCMAAHVDGDVMNDLRSKICARDPLHSEDVQKELQRSLLWLRDELRHIKCTYKSRHDAAADLLHIYAYTKCFFRVREYESVTSPPVFISSLDMGPKYSEKLGSDLQEYCKTYGANYCLGQLMYWYIQTKAEPDRNLAKASRGCLSMPEIGSFYSKVQKLSRHRVYGRRTVRSMLARMEKQPQRPWPENLIWSFKSSPKFFGSPMLDSVLTNSPIDKEMMVWLKSRNTIFSGAWDR